MNFPHATRSKATPVPINNGSVFRFSKYDYCEEEANGYFVEYMMENVIEKCEEMFGVNVKEKFMKALEEQTGQTYDEFMYCCYDSSKANKYIPEHEPFLTAIFRKMKEQSWEYYTCISGDEATDRAVEYTCDGCEYALDCDDRCDGFWDNVDNYLRESLQLNTDMVLETIEETLTSIPFDSAIIKPYDEQEEMLDNPTILKVGIQPSNKDGENPRVFINLIRSIAEEKGFGSIYHDNYDINSVRIFDGSNTNRNLIRLHNAVVSFVQVYYEYWRDNLITKMTHEEAKKQVIEQYCNGCGQSSGCTSEGLCPENKRDITKLMEKPNYNRKWLRDHFPNIEDSHIEKSFCDKMKLDDEIKQEGSDREPLPF